LGKRRDINEDDIEACVGISKEYNLFEFQSAVGKKNFQKSFQILQYFENNPKAAPIQMILPVLYSYFSKVYMLLGAKGDDKSMAAQTGINPWYLKDYRQTAALYGYEGIESALLLLHSYNLKSVGINDTGSDDASLLKELLSKMIMFK
jgi:DNA polymerase-3 subunit delta